MRAHLFLGGGLVATAMLGACDRPHWLNDDGWLAARCGAAADLLVRAGDHSLDLEAARASWRQTTDAFSATTDMGLEMREAAERAMGWRIDRQHNAREFIAESCSEVALADVRQRL